MGNTATAPVALREIASQASPLQNRFSPMAQTWVTLRDLPSEYSFDQALLLCEADRDTWVAWVPDHGEVRLDRAQFFRA